MTPRGASPTEVSVQAQAGDNFAPLGNFLRMFFSILTANPFNREDEAKANAAIATYISLAHLLELGILNGEIETTSLALDIFMEFLFKPTRDLSLQRSGLCLSF